MIGYLKNVIAEFPEIFSGKSPTPAADHLFQIREEKDAKPLEEERALAFHHTVAQLLFMATRARRDIQTAVAFLTTRVKNSRRGRLGQIEESPQVSQWCEISEIVLECRQPWSAQMVCRRITQCTLGL